MLRIAYSGLLVALLALGWGFSRTPGFVYGRDSTGALLYTSQLTSSGANDNINFQVGSLLFLVPLTLTLILKRSGFRTQSIVLTACWIIQGLLMLSLDAASIRQTVFGSRNWVLLLWIFCYLAIPAVYMVLRQRRLGHAVE